MKVYAFDLDGTIIEKGKRTSVADAIDRLWEDQDAFIVIYTARSYSIYADTQQLLKQNNIKYHALVMEKIRADVYIDDKALGYEESIADKLGY